MDLEAQYLMTRHFLDVTAETLTGWIERPHLLQPRLVGTTESAVVPDRQTNGDVVRLHLAVWLSPPPRTQSWLIAPDFVDGAFWLLTNWTTNPALQHRLRVLAVAENLAGILDSWPRASAAVPIDSEWLDDEDRSLLTLRALTA